MFLHKDKHPFLDLNEQKPIPRSDGGAVTAAATRWQQEPTEIIMAQLNLFK